MPTRAVLPVRPGSRGRFGARGAQRVGAQHEQLGAGSLECGGLAGKPVAGLLPGPGALQLLDLGEVDRAQ